MTTQDNLINRKGHLSSDFHGSDSLHVSSAISQNDTWAALDESILHHTILIYCFSPLTDQCLSVTDVSFKRT
jgi:hypothetical protein